MIFWYTLKIFLPKRYNQDQRNIWFLKESHILKKNLRLPNISRSPDLWVPGCWHYEQYPIFEIFDLKLHSNLLCSIVCLKDEKKCAELVSIVNSLCEIYAIFVMHSIAGVD